VKKAAFSLAMGIAVLVVGELLLQLLAAFFPSVAVVLGPGASPTINDPILGVRLNPALLWNDSAGFRNASRPEHARIVAIGDSHTQGYSVAREHAWPQLLQAKTGLTTYNMACGGYGTAHYLLLTQEALALRPDLIIIGFYAANDLADTFMLVYDRGQLPDLKTHDAAALERINDAMRSARPLTEAWEQTRDAARGGGFLLFARDSLSVHSKLYGFVRALHRWSRAEDRAGDVQRTVTDWRRIRRLVSRVNPDLLFAVERGAVRTVLTPRGRLIDQNDPRIQEGLRMSLGALRRIRERADGQARVLVLLIPTKELVFFEWVKKHSRALPQALLHLGANESAIWVTVKDYLDRNGIDWIDALPAMRACLDQGRNPYFIDDDGHSSTYGYECIADLLPSSDAVQRLLSTEVQPGMDVIQAHP